MGTKIKVNIKAAKTVLTIDEALSLLSVHIEDKKKKVHTFEAAGFGLMGCDMVLKTIKKELSISEDICLSGPNMKRMGHGVTFNYKKNNTYIFLETDKKKLDAIFKLRKIKY